MRTCPSLVRVVLAMALGIQAAGGAAVTLYRVDTPVAGPVATNVSIERAATTRVSAIGPGDRGMTQYVQEEVVSLLVLHRPNVTITVVNAPTTTTYTFEQGATLQYASYAPALQTGASAQIASTGIVQNCTLDVGKSTGACVEEVQLPRFIPGSGGASGSTRAFDIQTTTYTTTFTGALVPFATVTTSGAESEFGRVVDLGFMAGVVGFLCLVVIL